MPLLDHFRPPVLLASAWESFHTRWAVAIADDLNERLPTRFQAEVPGRIGVVSADVAEFDRSPGGGSPRDDPDSEMATVVYTPPAADDTMPISYPTAVVVEVLDIDRGRRVAAAIELVSPGNKDRPESRETFGAKSFGYLQAGAGLVIADIVTVMRFNLHNELVRLAEYDERFLMSGEPPTYVVAYRPTHRAGQDLTDIWRFPLAVGQPLPRVPLALRGTGVTVALDLEETYSTACRRARLS